MEDGGKQKCLLAVSDNHDQALFPGEDGWISEPEAKISSTSAASAHPATAVAISGANEKSVKPEKAIVANEATALAQPMTKTVAPTRSGASSRSKKVVDENKTVPGNHTA